MIFSPIGLYLQNAAKLIVNYQGLWKSGFRCSKFLLWESRFVNSASFLIERNDYETHQTPLVHVIVDLIRCTTFNSIPKILILFTKRVPLIYLVTICQQKTKDCAPSGSFQHKRQHRCFYIWRFVAFHNQFPLITMVIYRIMPELRCDLKNNDRSRSLPLSWTSYYFQ